MSQSLSLWSKRDIRRRDYAATPNSAFSAAFSSGFAGVRSGSGTGLNGVDDDVVVGGTSLTALAFPPDAEGADGCTNMTLSVSSFHKTSPGLPIQTHFLEPGLTCMFVSMRTFRSTSAIRIRPILVASYYVS